MSDPETYQGGLYIQPGPDISSRSYFHLEQGDLLVHSFDLQHGVHLWKAARHSVIFWIKDSLQAPRFEAFQEKTTVSGGARGHHALVSAPPCASEMPCNMSSDEYP